MSPLGLFTASLGAIAIYLTVRQDPQCRSTRLVTVALYAWIFSEMELYSDILPQMAYAALQLYGWQQRVRGGQNCDGRSVNRLNTAQRLHGLGAGPVGNIALGYLMANHTDTASPW